MRAENAETVNALIKAVLRYSAEIIQAKQPSIMPAKSPNSEIQMLSDGLKNLANNTKVLSLSKFSHKGIFSLTVLLSLIRQILVCDIINK